MNNLSIKEVGEKIRAKRNEMGLSLEDVGARTGLSFKTVLTIEHGKAISMLSLWAICKVLNIEIWLKDKEEEL